ncbi:MAG: SUMF1/EgtB/PvdO family nonheme iron enzyme [Acidobacteriota bacterium]|nr:SUMF1/EgtB/PvdO family nonheme iron enzyme [Acidobacteriota bacterium]
MSATTGSAITQHSGAPASHLSRARVQTDGLFDLIAPGALYARPIAERHRLIFYLGHFEAFDFNLLARRGMNAPSFHPGFDKLFERGIDPPPGAAPLDSPRDWPARAEVDKYRAQTRQWIDEHIHEIDPWLVQMAIEHRHMHAETFAYLLHTLPHCDKTKPSGSPPHRTLNRPAPANPMIPVSPGTATLGQNRDTFGWDNEFPAQDVLVASFGISKFKISNGEYLAFVREGGPVPHFWTRIENTWLYRGMFAQVDLPLDWPVWVTFQQASAYAKWRGLELPTEAQYSRAAQLNSADAARDNFDYLHWDPVPVDAGDTNPPLPSQMIGNGWEWTKDVFAPFRGFAPHPFYPGYSSDFFDGRHYVLKGASPRTAATFTRPSFRNWFRADYPYMYAGFRLVSHQGT